MHSAMLHVMPVGSVNLIGLGLVVGVIVLVLAMYLMWVWGYKAGFAKAYQIRRSLEELEVLSNEIIRRATAMQECIAAKAREHAGEKVRCRIIDVEQRENPLSELGVAPKTPDVSKPHVGKEGWAKYLPDGNVNIVLDDGTVLMGSECWWESIDA